MQKLDQEFWNQRYQQNETGWDIGAVSTPLKAYFDGVSDKKLKILIPGAGNAYEAEYLYQQGFQNVYVLDIAPMAIENFKKRFSDFPNERILLGDLFEHNAQYDLIIEQTFFCALSPGLRHAYANKMYDLLVPGGILAGVLFNIPLNHDRPPFGGNEAEYRQYFNEKFDILKMEPCYNSIEPRMGNELFIKLARKR